MNYRNFETFFRNKKIKIRKNNMKFLFSLILCASLSNAFAQQNGQPPMHPLQLCGNFSETQVSSDLPPTRYLETDSSNGPQYSSIRFVVRLSDDASSEVGEALLIKSGNGEYGCVGNWEIGTGVNNHTVFFSKISESRS
jgi:hypothetical protein